jgi:hypothetical protein
MYYTLDYSYVRLFDEDTACKKKNKQMSMTNKKSRGSLPDQI